MKWLNSFPKAWFSAGLGLGLLGGILINERRDILEKAEKKQPLCFKWDDGGDLVLVFLTWPFADSPEWNVKLKIAPDQERDVKMHRQWPMLRVFSKSNPAYGIQIPAQ